MTPEHEAFLDKASLLLLFTSNAISEASAILEADGELAEIGDVLISAYIYMEEKLSQLNPPAPTVAAGQAELMKRRQSLANRLRSAHDVFAVNAEQNYPSRYSRMAA